MYISRMNSIVDENVQIEEVCPYDPWKGKFIVPRNSTEINSLNLPSYIIGLLLNKFEEYEDDFKENDFKLFSDTSTHFLIVPSIKDAERLMNIDVLWDRSEEVEKTSGCDVYHIINHNHIALVLVFVLL